MLLRTNLRYPVQLGLVLVVLAFVPGSLTKLALLLVIWAVTFRSISVREAVVFAVVSALFSGMNAAALRQGIFAFRHPDALGMPVWEFFMWGFYVLHIVRFIGGSPPVGKVWVPLCAAIVFALPFATVSDSTMLTLVAGGIFALSLALFRERLDLAYAGYMILVGALVEYVGVHSGQWVYPGSPPGGVPLWFIPMWGGVGLFTRRLVVPILSRESHGRQ